MVVVPTFWTTRAAMWPKQRDRAAACCPLGVHPACLARWGRNDTQAKEIRVVLATAELPTAHQKPPTQLQLPHFWLTGWLLVQEVKEARWRAISHTRLRSLGVQCCCQRTANPNPIPPHPSPAQLPLSHRQASKPADDGGTQLIQPSKHPPCPRRFRSRRPSPPPKREIFRRRTMPHLQSRLQRPRELGSPHPSPCSERVS